ncbi:hypothetical protein [Metabacillus fastidiosus]|uniref:Uncharacterized protein n=1 Tax=Metabacillus fastidiosus TaxID=1458 RepID=A0ABU6P131_9BACI|nr:hypothetical protein [Metabacillus fastidiosus]
MPKNKVLEICCTNPNCKKWFRSPFFNYNLDNFNANGLKGLRSQCPTCGNMITASKKNIRIRSLINDELDRIS